MKEKIKNSLKAKFLGQYTGTSNKQRSLVILIVGFTLLFALIFILKINYNNNYTQNNNNNNSTNNNENNKEIEFLSLDKIFNNYIDNYDYNIIITDDETTIVYEGSINEGINNGKRTINNEEINYHIVNNIAIDLKTNKEILNLYDDYLSYYFIPSNIYDFINGKENNEETVDNKKIYTYNSIYNDGDIMFRITTTKDRIENIIFKYNNINYNIKFN